MAITPAQKTKIIKGRMAVDAYRTAHTQLHSEPWTPDVPDLHTPLLETMKAELKKQGFKELQEFFTASEQLTKEDLANGVITPVEVWK